MSEASARMYIFACHSNADTNYFLGLAFFPTWRTVLKVLRALQNKQFSSSRVGLEWTAIKAVLAAWASLHLAFLSSSLQISEGCGIFLVFNSILHALQLRPLNDTQVLPQWVQKEDMMLLVGRRLWEWSKGDKSECFVWVMRRALLEERNSPVICARVKKQCLGVS